MRGRRAIGHDQVLMSPEFERRDLIRFRPFVVKLENYSTVTVLITGKEDAEFPAESFAQRA